MSDYRQQDSSGMEGLGNAMQNRNALTKPDNPNTIKSELDRLASSINESRELLSGLESFTNEVCGPEEIRVEAEAKEQEPCSLLEHIELYNRQYREVNGRLAKAYMRLRETLG